MLEDELRTAKRFHSKPRSVSSPPERRPRAMTACSGRPDASGDVDPARGLVLAPHGSSSGFGGGGEGGSGKVGSGASAQKPPEPPIGAADGLPQGGAPVPGGGAPVSPPEFVRSAQRGRRKRVLSATPTVHMHLSGSSESRVESTGAEDESPKRTEAGEEESLNSSSATARPLLDARGPVCRRPEYADPLHNTKKDASGVPVFSPAQEESTSLVFYTEVAQTSAPSSGRREKQEIGAGVVGASVAGVGNAGPDAVLGAVGQVVTASCSGGGRSSCGAGGEEASDSALMSADDRAVLTRLSRGSRSPEAETTGEAVPLKLPEPVRMEGGPVQREGPQT